ncbi:hypothetical protein ACHAWO_004874 [Cyclotella atomus]|uniref:Integrase zinc-binding domain-containing protein n=1 Tax=Cyclotella atomus TaxID=382360 RepID=A0ABD3NCT3_9STRA
MEELTTPVTTMEELTTPVTAPSPEEEIESTPRQSLTAADHTVIISRALSLHPPGSPTRDTLLLQYLRSIAIDLEAAEEDAARAQKRVEDTRAIFDKTAELLSGKLDVSLMPKGEKLRKRGRKRKGEEDEGDGDYDERFVPPPEGPLFPPMIATSGGGMTELDVQEHRRAFYEKLTEMPYENLHEYVPPVTMPNLRTRAQLDEYAYVAKHWETGTETEDVKAFRRQYKTFYTKMKVSTENVGRRTGHHLRPLAGSIDREVFCRYGKNGESLMYVALEDLYDAIFEIHTLKGHRGWQSCKKLANLKYANLPQDHIRIFLETCPLCLGRKKVKVETPASVAEEIEPVVEEVALNEEVATV